MERRTAVLTMEELNKDLRNLQKQTRETKYSSMMKLLRLALSGQQVKKKKKKVLRLGPSLFLAVVYFFQTATFSLIPRYWYFGCTSCKNSHQLLLRVKVLMCSSGGKAALKVSGRQKLLRHECAGHKCGVRKNFWTSCLSGSV